MKDRTETRGIQRGSWVSNTIDIVIILSLKMVLS